MTDECRSDFGKTNDTRSRSQRIQISFNVLVSYYDFTAAAASRTGHKSRDEVHPLLRSLWWLDPMSCHCRIVSRFSWKMEFTCTSFLFKLIESATCTQETSEKYKFEHIQSLKYSKDQSKTRTSSQKHFFHRELDQQVYFHQCLTWHSPSVISDSLYITEKYCHNVIVTSLLHTF